MKKAKQLNDFTRCALLTDLLNLVNQKNELTIILNSNDFDCQIEYYYFDLVTIEQKIEMIKEILINNKF